MPGAGHLEIVTVGRYYLPMTNNRTLSAGLLSSTDQEALRLASKVSSFLTEAIRDPQGRADFKDTYSKISYSRDAGAGRGAGKLQRDALCTRGKTDKTPVSNRNLRWHRMIVAAETPSYAKEILDLDVRVSGSRRELMFKVDDTNTKSWVPGTELYALTDLHCAPTSAWLNLADDLKNWSNEDWGSNRCVIPAMEYSPADVALQSFLGLGIGLLLEVYDVEFEELISNYVNSSLPSDLGLSERSFVESSLRECPLCKKGFADDLTEFRAGERSINWQAPWLASKRSEGEDASLQVMHVSPLSESSVNHNFENVRFGHRWCNVSMTDHSLEETVSFFQFVGGRHD